MSKKQKHSESQLPKRRPNMIGQVFLLLIRNISHGQEVLTGKGTRPSITVLVKLFSLI